MRPACLLIRRSHPALLRIPHRRYLLTLAIESSCDDTCVAVLEKHKNNSVTLHFNKKITSDNREFGGISPLIAQHSHQRQLAALVAEALQNLPVQKSEVAHIGNTLLIKGDNGTEIRRKPDIIAVTRGPGMRANLMTGLDTAKGLAVAWQVPFLGVNHMQAHAITPRLVTAVNALDRNGKEPLELKPAFPFLSLLVSGGHTLLVHSKGLCEHNILVRSTDIAIGDLLDKTARDILPKDLLESSPTVSYGPLLESYAFPDAAETQDYNYTPPDQKSMTRRQTKTTSTGSLSIPAHDWAINPPLSKASPKHSSHFLASSFSFSGIGSQARRIVETYPGALEDSERRILAREVMRVAFEHLASRVLMALQSSSVEGINTLVVSGGVASNQYLKHILRAILDANGHGDVELVFPPPSLCTDNAAMIAWTGVEMYEAGYTSSLGVRALAKWAIDPDANDGGILGVGGCVREGGDGQDSGE
jgi:N6-L-threonylcarbamoyladenine synthase